MFSENEGLQFLVRMTEWRFSEDEGLHGDVKQQ